VTFHANERRVLADNSSAPAPVRAGRGHGSDSGTVGATATLPVARGASPPRQPLPEPPTTETRMHTSTVTCDHCGEAARHRHPSGTHLCDPCAAWRHGNRAGAQYATALTVARVLAHAEHELGRGTLRDLLELVLEHGADAIVDVPAVGVLHANETARPWRFGLETIR